MKKLLVVLMAAILVLSLAAVSMAAPTVGGEIKMIMKNDDVAGTADESKWYDSTETKVSFKSTVSDTVEAGATIKAKTNTKETASIYWDEYYITFKESFGTVKTGYWAYKLTPDLDIIKGHALKEVRANPLAAADFNIAEGFTFGVAYALDGNQNNLTSGSSPKPYGDVKTYDGSYDIKLAYKSDLFGGEIHAFNTGDCATKELESATALDVWCQPIDMLKVYLGYVDVEFKDLSTPIDAAIIIGGYATFGNAYARAEYNIEDFDADFNNYGIKLGYNFTNKVIAELKMEKAEKDQTKQEVSMKVSL